MPDRQAVNGRDPSWWAEGISPSRLFQAIRLNQPLFLFVSGLTVALTALLVVRGRPDYSARAVIRMASERQTLTSGVEDAPQATDRLVDPVLSAVQVLTSRSLVGAVVDSLGLRLSPVTAFSLDAPLIGRRFPIGAYTATLDSSAPRDTLLLKFSGAGVIARSRQHHGAAAYGSPLRLGPVTLVVPAAPPVPYALLAVEPRDVVIDLALRRLKVTPRPGTDVIDVRFADPDPALAQGFANHLKRRTDIRRRIKPAGDASFWASNSGSPTRCCSRRKRV